MSERKPKIYTMKELSAAIGVSRPTLSRFFQDPLSVRSATAEKIRMKLEEVDYVYNFIATRQNRKTTGLVGVIIPHFNDLFFTSLTEAIDEVAREAGLTIITLSSHGNEGAEIKAVEKLRSMSVDGAIIAPLGSARSNTAFEAAIFEFPIVFVDSRPSTPVAGADFVGNNNTQSITAMVEYLCRAGESPIFLNMPHLNSNALERKQTFSNAMRELGNDSVFVDHSAGIMTWDFEAFGYEVMDSHFSHQRHTTATLLCANDRIAIGAIRAANRHGLFAPGHEVRGRLRIAGHDDHPMSQYMYPALTTIAQDVAGIGAAAVNLLTERAYGSRGRSPVELQMDAVLRLREST